MVFTCWWEAGQRICHQLGCICILWLPSPLQKSVFYAGNMLTKAFLKSSSTAEAHVMALLDWGCVQPSLRRQSIGQLCFITDKNEVVRFYLLIECSSVKQHRGAKLCWANDFSHIRLMICIQINMPGHGYNSLCHGARTKNLKIFPQDSVSQTQQQGR